MAVHNERNTAKIRLTMQTSRGNGIISNFPSALSGILSETVMSGRALASYHWLISNVRTDRTSIRCQSAFKNEWARLNAFGFLLGQKNSFRFFHGPRLALGTKPLAFAHTQ